MLPKHPDLMADEDLARWIDRLLSDKTPVNLPRLQRNAGTSFAEAKLEAAKIFLHLPMKKEEFFFMELAKIAMLRTFQSRKILLALIQLSVSLRHWRTFTSILSHRVCRNTASERSRWTNPESLFIASGSRRAGWFPI